jgi:hypothetical protein
MRTHKITIYTALSLIAIAIVCTLARSKGVEITIIPPQPEKALKTQNMSILKWVDQLETYESGGNENIVIVDTNGRKSYGCLQFQKRTFVEQVKKYNLLPQAEDIEIPNMIMDCDFQKRLAYEMILDNNKNYRHWATSVKRGLGYVE